jgi:hypothetical protein
MQPGACLLRFGDRPMRFADSACDKNHPAENAIAGAGAHE